ncbi:FG-GAP repeat protein [Variovorax sp. J22P168]|uniref:FG-GAP repeat protein n=1 Tax=Variovorax jilinensis TaxID=3053513 RepID=UPI002575DE90|nr:FG-GAP repeat protein [Variovorax sp. J22P168]MDM0015019.1 FG-GAP repeat protein [Variovorax sp. J22P168]
MRRFIAGFEMCLVAAILSACGGGGGGGGGGGASGIPLFPSAPQAATPAPEAPLAPVPPPDAPGPAAPTPSFTIGGSVSGLTGTLVLRNNGKDDLTLSADGAFRFVDPVTAGNPYAVTIAQQPLGLICAVSAGQGTAAITVGDVRVVCSAVTYPVGGTLTGLSGGTLGLRNNAGDALTLTANGSFAFAQSLPLGAAYNVTVHTQPDGQTCVLTGTSGSISAAVTSIMAHCSADPASLPPLIPSAPAVGYAPRAFLFNWPTSDHATYYRLGEDPSASGSFTLVADNLASTTYALQDIALTRSQAAWRYALQACNANGCSGWSLPATPDANRAIGYFKPGTVDNLFGATTGLSPDGRMLAVGTQGSLQLYALSAGQWQWAQTISMEAASYPRAAFSNDGTMLVGMFGYDGALGDQGQVQVFTKAPGGWTQTDVWDPPSPRRGGNFGDYLGISSDGTVAVVGEYGILGSHAGRFHVYRKTSGTWSREATITPDNPRSGELFGVYAKISADGATIVVGAQYEGSASTTDETDASARDAGAAFVYAYDAGTATWTKRAYLKAPSPVGGELFGSATAISADGSTVVIGARNHDVGSITRAGAAYVYRRTAGTYALVQTIHAPQIVANMYFGGFGLALNTVGDVLAIGAPGDSSAGTGIDAVTTQGPAFNSGAAHLYRLTDGQFVHARYLKASNTEANDLFGRDLAMSADGGTIAIGATAEASSASGIGGDQADNSATNRGAVYLY